MEFIDIETNQIISGNDKPIYVNVLGTKYEIIEKQGEDDKNLVDADGYTDYSNRTIVLRIGMGDDMGDPEAVWKRVLRHEITHAFLLESGLDVCSGSTDCWARNEIMVDWIACQMPKIWEAWKSVGAV